MIKISFIVVALNAARCLPLLLEDLLAQTIPPEQLELLLVDSMSTDGTEAVMRDFAAHCRAAGVRTAIEVGFAKDATSAAPALRRAATTHSAAFGGQDQ